MTQNTAPKPNEPNLGMKREPEVSAPAKSIWRKLRPVLILLLIAGVIALIFFANKYRLSQQSFVEVDLATVQEQSIREIIYTSGKVSMKKTEGVYAQGSGVITALPVQLWQEVKAGQVLAYLDTQEVDIAIQEAEVSLALAQANLEKAIESSGPTELKQIEDSIAQAQMALDDARHRLERSQTLLKAGVIPQAEVDTLLFEVETKEDQLRVAQSQLGLAQTEIQAANKALEIQVNQAKIALLSAQSQRERLVISAPISGQVLQLEVQQGEYLSPGKQVAVIGQVQGLEVEAELNEIDAAQVQVGQTVEIFTEAISSAVYSGKVTEISPQATVRNTTQGEETIVLVKITLPGNTQLRPGNNVDLNIITKMADNAVVIPYEALAESDAGKEVVVVQEGLTQRRTVETGIMDDRYIQILSGLALGENIVLNPAETLADGSAVKAKSPETQGDEGAKP